MKRWFIALALTFLPSLAYGQTTCTTLSTCPTATTFGSSDFLWLLQGGATKKLPGSVLFGSTPLTAPSLTITGILDSTGIQINKSGQATYTVGQRAPLFIWVDPSTNAAGHTAAIEAWVGNNPTVTPGANDFVVAQLAINNNNGRCAASGGCWLMTGIQIQSTAAGGGTSPGGIMHGIEIGNIANFPQQFPLRAIGSGAAVHAIELVANTGSTYNPQTAVMIWSSADAPEQFWNFGVGCANVQYACLKGENYESYTTPPFIKGLIWDTSNSAAVIKDDGTHTNFIDFSGNPTFTNFVKGLTTADTTLIFKNAVDHNMAIGLDSGTSSAQGSIINYYDRGAIKWIAGKGSDNAFTIYNPNTTVVGFTINSTDNISLVGGNVTISSAGAIAAPSVALFGCTIGSDKFCVTGTAAISSTLTSAAHTITSASATSLAVGRLGATTPAFTVDSSTASQVAGFKITGAATGGTVALVTTDSGSNTNLTINAKGSGTIGIGSVSTGIVTITPALSLGSASLTLTSGAVGLSKMTASASAPGAGGGKLELVCGTNAGTAKLVVYAGTSGTAVTITDNIGAGVTGC